MELLSSEWKDRIDQWIHTLEKDLYIPVQEIHWDASTTREDMPVEKIGDLNFCKVNPGFSWGRTYEYCWFRTKIEIDKKLKGKRIVLDLEPGGESSLFVNGEPFGTFRADWIAKRHHFIEDNTLTMEAVGNEKYEILMETYAGQYYPDGWKGACAPGPVMPGDYQDSLKEGHRRTLGLCTYGIWNEEGYQLYMDVMTLTHLLKSLDPTSLRAAEIAEALKQFTLCVDFEQQYKERVDNYIYARHILKPMLEKKNGSTEPVFYAIGNAHLDLAWLWPMAETVRKTERTFSAQIRHMKEYPDYKFLQSQPAEYEMCRIHYPELFEEIKAMVKKGQWIAEGAMWVEPDTNMAGGESLIRQIVYGKKYYKEVFGVNSEILWLPDSFGYSAVLPQILKKSDIKYLVTQKIFWSYSQETIFPYHYFWWQGMDGSRIISFLPTSYEYDMDPETLNKVWKNRRQIDNLKEFLVPFGYGDGGGGPTRDHIEYAKREKNLEGCVKVKLSDPKEFFHSMEKIGPPKDIWRGELYFSAHRGTYTGQAYIKKYNRQCESALQKMELWNTLAYVYSANAKKAFQYPYDDIEKLWKRFLVLQFHDILPGSSIARVYQEAECEFINIIKDAQQLENNAIKELSHPEQYKDVHTGKKEKLSCVSFVNSLGFQRTEYIKLPEVFKDGAIDKNGRLIPSIRTAKGVKALVCIPAMGAVSLSPLVNSKERKNTICERRCFIRQEEDGFYLRNEKLNIYVDNKGEIKSFQLYGDDFEFAAGSLNHLKLYKDVPRKFDAWDIDSNYEFQEVTKDNDFSVSIAEDNALSVSLLVKGMIGNSDFTQEIRLIAGSETIEFTTRVIWKELHRLLKVAFPINVYTDYGINEIQFGYITRPTHRSSNADKEKFEVCNHRYSVLCDAAHGVAVLNDSKYGISMKDNVMELSLLTASASPEMRADNREQTFQYAISAWRGHFEDSNVISQGYKLNSKLDKIEGVLDVSTFYRCDCRNIIFETVKLSNDRKGDIILRLYEAMNCDSDATIEFKRFQIEAVYLCDLLENTKEKVNIKNNTIKLYFHNFEIHTLRLKVLH